MENNRSLEMKNWTNVRICQNFLGRVEAILKSEWNIHHNIFTWWTQLKRINEVIVAIERFQRQGFIELDASLGQVKQEYVDYVCQQQTVVDIADNVIEEALVFADKIAFEVDKWVRESKEDYSRSAISDRRLEYWDPFHYEYSDIVWKNN